MKHFEASGLWYPSDDPDNAVGGTLKFDEKGLQLALLGTLRQGWSPWAERYPIIHGVLGDSPYGAFVTLIDSFRTAHKFNMVGATSEKIRCHSAMVGDFHLPDGPVSFEKLNLDYSYLTEWVGRGGMEVDRKRTDGKLTFVATYTQPENIQFPFGNKTLTLGFQSESSSSTHRTTLTEEARLVVQPVGDLTSATLVQEHVRTLQDLITFATDRPNEVEEIAYRAEKDERGLTPKLNLIYDPIFQLKERKDHLHPTDMLFTFEDCKAANINIFQEWLDFSKKHPAFREVYFGSTYAGPRYLDDRFKKVVEAFTLLCSTLKDTSEKTVLFLADVAAAMRAHFSEDEREFMNHLVPTRGEVEMSNHLRRMLVEDSDLMSQVIEDIPAFVRAVSDTLGFIERRERGARPPLEGDDLHYAVEKIKMLIKIVVLKELGFGQEAVRGFVERNEKLRHLKMV